MLVAGRRWPFRGLKPGIGLASREGRFSHRGAQTLCPQFRKQHPGAIGNPASPQYHFPLSFRGNGSNHPECAMSEQVDPYKEKFRPDESALDQELDAAL